MKSKSSERSYAVEDRRDNTGGMRTTAFAVCKKSLFLHLHITLSLLSLSLSLSLSLLHSTHPTITLSLSTFHTELCPFASLPFSSRLEEGDERVRLV